MFGKVPGLQGGFVWEWCDHGLRRHEPDGTEWFAYGGDFGEADHDSSFVCDGLVSPGRVPHPLLEELAALTQPVAVSWVSGGSAPGGGGAPVRGGGGGGGRRRRTPTPEPFTTRPHFSWSGREQFDVDGAAEAEAGPELRIENRRWFTGLGDLCATWTVEVDGRRAARGRLPVPEVGPQASQVVPSPVAGVELAGGRSGWSAGRRRSSTSTPCTLASVRRPVARTLPSVGGSARARIGGSGD